MSRARLPALLLLLLGLGGIIGGWRYEAGNLTSMGPGFMPVMFGALLALLAVATLAGEWRARSGPDFQPLRKQFRPLACALGSILLWALLAEPAGFLPAALAQLLLAFAAVPRQRWPLVLAGSACICLASWALFVLLLGIPLEAVG